MGGINWDMIGAVVTIIGLIITILAWRRPVQPVERRPTVSGRQSVVPVWIRVVALLMIVGGAGIWIGTRVARTSIPPLGIGSTWVNPKDEGVYVYVPAGEFLMGSTDDSPVVYLNEIPQHIVNLNAFWIAQTEVTNAQYVRCVHGGACTKPNNDWWDDGNYADHPVVSVTWYQANDYAEWVGGRLPSEAEWEKAASWDERQGRKLVYPWGDEFTWVDKFVSHKCNIRNGGRGNTTPVGTYPQGASLYGALNMAGNASEWTSSLYKPYPYDPDDGRENLKNEGQRVVRGGSWGGNSARCAHRYGDDPGGYDRFTGLRVIASPPLSS